MTILNSLSYLFPSRKTFSKRSKRRIMRTASDFKPEQADYRKHLLFCLPPYTTYHKRRQQESALDIYTIYTQYIYCVALKLLRQTITTTTRETTTFYIISKFECVAHAQPACADVNADVDCDCGWFQLASAMRRDATRRSFYAAP